MKKQFIYSALLSMFLFSCNTTTETEKHTPQDFNTKVKTAPVEKLSEDNRLILTGKVDYDKDNLVEYTSLVNGVIDQSLYSLGTKVEKGQTLLVVRSTELNNLQSEMLAAQSQLKVAKREYQSAQEMYEDGMLSQKELLEAEAGLSESQAEVNKLQRDQSLYGSNTENGLYVIKAPISGYVVEKETKGKGSMVSEGDLLFAIADLSSVWVIANVYQGNIAAVKEGVAADITTLSYPREVFKGNVDMVSPTFDNEEKVVKAIIKIDNKDLRLRPEMSATIELNQEANSNGGVLTVPSNSLIFDNNKYFVVVSDNDDYKVVAVDLIGKGQDVAYISGNIKEGDKVVIKNQLLLYSKITEENA